MSYWEKQQIWIDLDEPFRRWENRYLCNSPRNITLFYGQRSAAVIGPA